MTTAVERAVSVVLNHEGALLVIRRQKSGRKYCVLPGGGVEDGESACDAVLRELSEETGLSGSIVRKLKTIQHPDRVAHYYLVSAEGGSLQLGGPELELQSVENWHRPEWMPLTDIDVNNLQPIEVRPLLVHLLDQD